MAVTVEQAACNALRAWLASQLPGVQVLDTWPDDDKRLPDKAVTVLLVGKAQDEWTDPKIVHHENIHAALPAPLDIDTAAITATATANAALNVVRARLLDHLSDTDAHAAADTTTTITAPAVVDLDSVAQGSALANNLRTALAAHELREGPHPQPDRKNAPTAPAATNQATLIALAKNLVDKLGAHFATRLYTWQVGSRVQPIQLDVWATYEATRDEILADLEQAIRIGSAETVGGDVFDQDFPVGLNVVVELGDTWAGGDHRAVFDFESPTRGPDEPKAQEWRATYLGLLDAPMLVKAQSARLGRIRVEQTLNDAAGPTLEVAWADNDDGATDQITPG